MAAPRGDCGSHSWGSRWSTNDMYMYGYALCICADASPLTCPLASCGNLGVVCVDECVLVGGGVVMLPCVVWFTLPRSTLLTPSALLLLFLVCLASRLMCSGSCSSLCCSLLGYPGSGLYRLEALFLLTRSFIPPSLGFVRGVR